MSPNLRTGKASRSSSSLGPAPPGASGRGSGQLCLMAPSGSSEVSRAHLATQGHSCLAHRGAHLLRPPTLEAHAHIPPSGTTPRSSQDGHRLVLLCSRTVCRLGWGLVRARAQHCTQGDSGSAILSPGGFLRSPALNSPHSVREHRSLHRKHPPAARGNHEHAGVCPGRCVQVATTGSTHAHPAHTQEGMADGQRPRTEAPRHPVTLRPAGAEGV